jgi:hypothetical protein
MLGEYLSAFFAANAAEIAEEWPEILRLSEDLVARSVPWEPAAPEPGIVPLDVTELDQPAVPRVVSGGALRSLRPVTTTATPGPGEMDDLLQLCRYVLYHATFNHMWTHDGQYDAGGELAYAVFGLRNGSLGAEDDPAINPPPLTMLEAISTNTVGLHANYGYILADEEHDVPPALKDALRARTEAFAALGVDVNHIRSRINI